ncbi:hypothetical protein [Fulvimarina sp. MAC8]|uniref:hypothetical protein n=1 Tax=Fulvimarina sp. MAC8 TaxID=3162874 RepID=UPI0032ECD599
MSQNMSVPETKLGGTIYMRYAIFIFTVFSYLMLSLSTSQAGFFDSAFGVEPSCEIEDTDCIRALYIHEIIQRTIDDSSPTYAARDFAHESIDWSKSQRDNALAKFADVPVDSSFMDAYEDERNQIEAHKSFNYTGILRAVEEGNWPDGVEWSDFISKAVSETLYNTQSADKLWLLWQENQGFFEEYAKTESVSIMDWGLFEKTEETLDFLMSDQADQQVAMRGLDSIVWAIQVFCQNGQTKQSDALISAYDRIAATQQYTDEADFLPLKQEALIALSCGTEKEGNSKFEDLATLVNAKVEKQGDTFETDWAYDGLMDVAIPYALKKWKAGEKTAARKIFLRGASRKIVVTSQIEGKSIKDISVWDVLVEKTSPELAEIAERRLTEKIKEIMKDADEASAYDLRLDTRYDYFAEDFDPTFEICCVHKQLLKDMLETIEAARDSHDVAEVSAKLLELMDRYENVEGEQYIDRTTTELRLAALERARGCNHSAETQQYWLRSATEGKYSSTRAEALAAFLTYRNTEPGTSTPEEACLFE